MLRAGVHAVIPCQQALEDQDVITVIWHRNSTRIALKKSNDLVSTLLPCLVRASGVTLVVVGGGGISRVWNHKKKGTALYRGF